MANQTRISPPAIDQPISKNCANAVQLRTAPFPTYALLTIVRQLQRSHVTLPALLHQWDTHDDHPQAHNHVSVPSGPFQQPCSTCAIYRTLSRQHGTP